MACVWKFEIEFTHETQTVEGPHLGRIVMFGIQDTRFCVWAEVHPGEKMRARRIKIVPTGGDIPFGFVHNTSIQDGGFVWHLYEDDGITRHG